jgi:hypothetical protein
VRIPQHSDKYKWVYILKIRTMYIQQVLEGPWPHYSVNEW